MKYLSVILVFVLAGCAHARDGMPSERLVKRCSPVLQEILTVQDFRSINNMWIQDRRSSGIATEDDYEAWRNIEHSLASRANELYSIADRRRCFRGLDKMFLTSS